MSGALLLSAVFSIRCSDEGGDDDAVAGTSSGSAGVAVTAGSGGVSGSAGAGVSGGGAGGTLAGAAGAAGSAGVSPVGGSGGTPAAGAAGAGTSGAGLGGTAGGDAGGSGGTAATGGMEDLPPEQLSQTGLFTMRGTDGTLVLAEGVREFEPTYALWSDGAEKHRYIYLPPGSKIDTTDPDHWVFPIGTKLWKSFSIDSYLVETRLLERIGEEVNGFRYSTYFWETAEATDATRMVYRNQKVDAGGTTHDIPSGKMCERCHNGIDDRVLGFSALQLNHEQRDPERPGVTLATLNDEGWLTTPIPLTIGFPGEGVTKDALGYFHANCGNCHNDSPGVPLENLPAPQMYLRVLVGDTEAAQTGPFLTAVNQRVTVPAENVMAEYRILGGSPEGSATFERMSAHLRLTEDQMPPIGSELADTDGGLTTMDAWIRSLPAP